MPLADKMAWPTSSDGRSAMKAVNDGQQAKGNHEQASKSGESMWLWVRWVSMISKYSFSPHQSFHRIHPYSRPVSDGKDPFVYHCKMSCSLKLKSVWKNVWWLPLVWFVVLTAISLSVLCKHTTIPKSDIDLETKPFWKETCIPTIF